MSGNHEQKLVRALNGRKVRVAHGLREVAGAARAGDDAFTAAGQVVHGRPDQPLRQLDGGELVVAHAGFPREAYHGRASGRVRSFALYGDTTGETDEYGLPGTALSVGRASTAAGRWSSTGTPRPLDPEWVSNTICLDTGVVFGGGPDRAALPGEGTTSRSRPSRSPLFIAAAMGSRGN